MVVRCVCWCVSSRSGGWRRTAVLSDARDISDLCLLHTTLLSTLKPYSSVRYGVAVGDLNLECHWLIALGVMSKDGHCMRLE